MCSTLSAADHLHTDTTRSSLSVFARAPPSLTHPLTRCVRVVLCLAQASEASSPAIGQQGLLQPSLRVSVSCVDWAHKRRHHRALIVGLVCMWDTECRRCLGVLCACLSTAPSSAFPPLLTAVRLSKCRQVLVCVGHTLRLPCFLCESSSTTCTLM